MDDIQTEAQAKRLGKTEQGFGDPRDDIERSAVHVLRVPPDEREQEEMVPTVFSRFDYKYHLTDQVSSRTPKHNKHKATCKDIIIKMLKIARKISRAAKEQWHAHGGRAGEETDEPGTPAKCSEERGSTETDVAKTNVFLTLNTICSMFLKHISSYDLPAANLGILN